MVIGESVRPVIGIEFGQHGSPDVGTAPSPIIPPMPLPLSTTIFKGSGFLILRVAICEVFFFNVDFTLIVPWPETKSSRKRISSIMLEFLRREWSTAHRKLCQAVVLGWVVTAGDHHATVGFQFYYRKNRKAVSEPVRCPRPQGHWPSTRRAGGLADARRTHAAIAAQGRRFGPRAAARNVPIARLSFSKTSSVEIGVSNAADSVFAKNLFV